MQKRYDLLAVFSGKLQKGAVCLLVWLCCPAAAAASDPEIEALVKLISRDSLDTTVRRMVAFETRFMGSDSNAAAARWLGERLVALGYREVRFDTFAVNVSRQFRLRTDTAVIPSPFVLQDLAQWNVVATKPGALFPDRQVVLGAHYDSISLDRLQEDQDVAPGADDDASGVAGLLEIARLLRGVDLEATVVFALFGAEELGLVGSRDFAARARARGDEILLMLQLDSVGTRSAISGLLDAFSIDTIGPYLSLGEGVAQAAEDYTEVRARDRAGGRVRITNRGCGCSDHQSFIDQGYPALGVFQYFDNPETHINMSTDTLEQVDLSLVEGITGAVLGGMVQVAGFPARLPDFDGDREVAFSDFVLFARAFGMAVEGTSDARFDLDRDGWVRFSDFVLFARNFGRKL